MPGEMTQNRRIFLNVIATYGRSVVALVCGLFTSRWVLMSLGQLDYGLFGVVGVLTSFIGFLNGILAVSVSRFYAFSVGRAKVSPDGDSALEDCRAWFNTALLIHTVAPIVLMVIGYPLGQWAIAHWLVIPAERIPACQWVFRFSCLSCFVAMVNVPFQAMYLAKQYIAELTVYSFLQTVANVVCLYYMVTHPRDWLVGYSIVVCAVAVLPQILICIRAVRVFQECKFVRRYFLDLGRLPALFKYVGWQAFGLTGQLLKSQGIAILINKAFGAKVNAAMTVANSVNAQSSTLSSALLSAFTPAITQACGAGDGSLMRKMAFRASKMGVLLMLLFAIPLVVELPLVLALWLKTPPAFTTTLCIGVVVALLLEKSTYGHMIALNAKGEIAAYQMAVGILIILTLPLAWLFVKMGFGVRGVAFALIATAGAASVGRIYFSRRLVGMGLRPWLFRLVLPVVICILFTGAAGVCARNLLQPSFLRLVVTTAVCELVFLPLSWEIALEREEREYVCRSFKRGFQKIKGWFDR